MSAYLNPVQTAESCAASGVAKTKRPAAQLFVLGVLAGALIAFGCAATNTAVYGIADVWTARTVCALLFPFGLGMVVVTGAELFTGNSLICVGLLDRRYALSAMLRNWAIVYPANFVGSLLVAAGCAYFGQMNYSGGQLAVYTMRVAAGKCALPFANAFVLGVLCNALVCLAVLMAASGQDNVSRLVGAYFPICFFVLSGFEHSVANMYYIGAGLMAKSIPAYAQLAAEAGVDLSALTLRGFLLGNLLPVTLGNIAGGLLVGALTWFCHLRKGK